MERFDKPDQVTHEEVIDKMKEAISKLEGGLKQEIHSPKVLRVHSPRPVINLRPVIDPTKPVIGPPIPVIGPPLPVVNSTKLETDTPELIIETTKTDIETSIPTIETFDVTTSITDIEVLIADVPSPSVIDTSDADFERIVPDDDTTKSDIEMGNESPRLDIDSQPILVDIDAPLDMDPPESLFKPTQLKKYKKLKLKDFVKPRRKVKKEQKKKLMHQKWAEVDQVKSELAEMKIRMKEMMREIEREKQVCTSCRRCM